MDDFCDKCGCQLDGYWRCSAGNLCDECLEEWAEENEVYL
jgi:hypothetical protein